MHIDGGRRKARVGSKRKTVPVLSRQWAGYKYPLVQPFKFQRKCNCGPPIMHSETGTVLHQYGYASS